jgi:hypothetical protein
MLRRISHKPQLSPLPPPFPILDVIDCLGHELLQKKKAQPQGRAFD